MTSDLTTIETQYINTDLDLESSYSFETLHHELAQSCCVLHYLQNDDGHWVARIESNCDHNIEPEKAATDIFAIVEALNSLSERAKQELAVCHLREFNLGFYCGDNWGYIHQLPQAVVQAVAALNGSVAVTLYPTRNIDGTRKKQTID